MKNVQIELPWDAFNNKPIQTKDLERIKNHIKDTIKTCEGFTYLLVGLHDADMTYVSNLLATGRRIDNIGDSKSQHTNKVRKTLLEISQLIIEVHAMQLVELFKEKDIPEELDMALCLFDMMYSTCISMLDLGTFKNISANTAATAGMLIQTYMQAFVIVGLVLRELHTS